MRKITGLGAVESMPALWRNSAPDYKRSVNDG